MPELPELSLADYLDASHVIVDTTGERQSAIDRRLEDLGERRRAGLTVPYHSLAAEAVLGTKLILTLPERLLARQPAEPGLRVLPAPEAVRPMRYQMAWHPRLDGDLGQQWLRDVIRGVAAELPPVGAGRSSG